MTGLQMEILLVFDVHFKSSYATADRLTLEINKKRKSDRQVTSEEVYFACLNLMAENKLVKLTSFKLKDCNDK